MCKQKPSTDWTKDKSSESRASSEAGLGTHHGSGEIRIPPLDLLLRTGIERPKLLVEQRDDAHLVPGEIAEKDIGRAGHHAGDGDLAGEAVHLE